METPMSIILQRIVPICRCWKQSKEQQNGHNARHSHTTGENGSVVNIDLSCTSSGDANSAMAKGKTDSDPGRLPTGLGLASARMSSVPCSPLACVPDMHEFFCLFARRPVREPIQLNLGTVRGVKRM